MIARFGSTKSTQQYAGELLAYRQAADQSVASLHYEILRLVSKAYPDIKDAVAQKTLAVSFFRKALRSDIRSKIELTMDESASLENLLKRAKQFEQLSSLDQPPAVVNAVSSEPAVTSATESTSDSSLAALTAQVEQLTVAVMKMSSSQVNQNQNRENLPRSNPRTTRCYICHRVGHIAPNCQRRNFNALGSARRDAVTCFRCGNFGHRAASCNANQRN